MILCKLQKYINFIDSYESYLFIMELSLIHISEPTRRS